MRQHYGQVAGARPFVKWAGGKRQLVPAISAHIPERFARYFEPFLGGGAVLFHILADNPARKCHISDLNSDLILTYVTVRDRPDELIRALRVHAARYAEDEKAYYYMVRASEPRGQIAKCARLLFLNRTCFNGLYRVNSNGKFNVPLGRYENPNIVNEANIRATSSALHSRGIKIGCRDFGAILEEAGRDDFVYFDPPYQPASRTANFKSYTSRDFGADDLARLAGVCDELDLRGCKVIFSHSDTGGVRSMFGQRWKVTRVGVHRAINSDSKKRSGHSELLIRNF